MKKYIFTLLVLMTTIAHSQEKNEWVTLYCRQLTQKDYHAKEAEQTIFEKQDVAPFTQLIFSWNAFRPKKGYFVFCAQVRDKKTKQWSAWHPMFEWGAGKQRSLGGTKDAHSEYHYVRLEMKPGKSADAFRIKVARHDGVDITQLKAVAVTAVDFSRYAPEEAKTCLARCSSVQVKQVPKIAQFALEHPEKMRICSPTSCTMLTSYLEGIAHDPVNAACAVYDASLDSYGSWPLNTAHAYECLGGKCWFFSTRLNSFSDIYAQLSRGFPVIVSVRGSLPGAAKPYPHGHLLLVVGLDAQKSEVICHDPAFDAHAKTEIRYPVESFLTAWEKSRRLAYWCEPHWKFDTK